MKKVKTSGKMVIVDCIMSMFFEAKMFGRFQLCLTKKIFAYAYGPVHMRSKQLNNYIS